MAATVVALAGYRYLGCFRDYIEARVLDGAYKDGTDMTVESCASYCNGGISPTRFYPLIGVEFGRACFCGDEFTQNLGQQNETSCNYKCMGNGNEACGGVSFINLYSATLTPPGIMPLTPFTSPASTTAATTSTTSTTSTIGQTPTLSSGSINNTSHEFLTATIAVSVIAGILGLVLCGIICVWVWRRGRRRSIPLSQPHLVSHVLSRPMQSVASQEEQMPELMGTQTHNTL